MNGAMIVAVWFMYSDESTNDGYLLKDQSESPGSLIGQIVILSIQSDAVV
jgi:hypothetical protein